MLKYHSLRDKVFRLENLYSAFHHVKKNKGKAGLDRISIKQFEADLDTNIQNIHKELKAEIYKPSPVLRVYIPKGRHEKRPLGIPIVKDRIVQQAIRQVIEPIFEKDFSDNSFGFRPNRQGSRGRIFLLDKFASILSVILKRLLSLFIVSRNRFL